MNFGHIPADSGKQLLRAYLVEDNPTLRENLIGTLEELAPVRVIGSSDCQHEGVDWLTRHEDRWDLAVVDLFLKKGGGLRIIEACRQRGPQQKMVVFSNYATPEIRTRCAELGIDAVYDKSTEIDALLAYCAVQSRKLNAPVLDIAAGQEAELLR